jgi:3-oxoacid CoA-transferase subunit A
VDKYIRLAYGHAWFENEELSNYELNEIIERTKGKIYDFVLTHTTAYSDMPREVFLAGVDQNKIENRTEKALEIIKHNITYNTWYAGHFHTEKIDGKLHLLYKKYEQII